MHSGTDPNGIYKIYSRETGVFNSGQVTVYQSGVYVGTGTTNAYKRWGLASECECSALFFEWASKSYYMLRGHVQSATSTTIQLSNQESSTDDNYNDDFEIKIIDGTGIGQTRTITDYTGSTQTATVATWTALQPLIRLHVT